LNDPGKPPPRSLGILPQLFAREETLTRVLNAIVSHAGNRFDWIDRLKFAEWEHRVAGY
jgi:hypothetical protein